MRGRGPLLARVLLASLLMVGPLLPRPGRAHGGEAHDPPPPGPTLRYRAPAPGTYELPVIQWLHPHRLLDSRGREVPLLDLEPGEMAVVSFVYLSCSGACPLATAMLQRLDGLLHERGLGERVELLTVSFDPARDPPERMAAQRRALAPQGRWRFLTAADPAAIGPVLRDFGQNVERVVDAEGGAAAQLDHVLKVFLVDASGGVRNIYSTGFLDPRVVLNDLLTVLPALSALPVAPGDGPPSRPASSASPS